MPGAVLLVLYVALLLAPIALAWALGLPRRPFLDELSSGLAMAAFAAMLVEFALSGRFQLISQGIGMDTTMRLHQLFARTMLALVLLHPFLYTLPIPANPPPWDATAESYLRLGGATLLTGGAAWILIFVLVVTGIARDSLPYKYETWRLMHGLGAALVAGLSMHHAMSAGRYTAEGPLTTFWIVLFGLAVATLLWVYLFSPLLQLRRTFEVVSCNPIAEDTWELAVARRDGGTFTFEAGQFVWLGLTRTPFTLHENPFSISSAPSDGRRVEFVIREVGDFTRSLRDVRDGQTAWLDGPYGNLTIPVAEAPGVGLIAGGVGVAPLLSILREMQARGDQRPVVLLYGNRVAEQIVYRDELDRLADEDNVSVVHVLGEPPEGWSGPVGQIDTGTIQTAFGSHDGWRGWTYLMCGPPGMLDSAEAALMSFDVPTGRVQSERFVYD